MCRIYNAMITLFNIHSKLLIIYLYRICVAKNIFQCLAKKKYGCTTVEMHYHLPPMPDHYNNDSLNKL